MLAAFILSLSKISNILDGQNGSLVMKAEQTETGNQTFSRKLFKERLILTLIFTLKIFFSEVCISRFFSDHLII